MSGSQPIQEPRCRLVLVADDDPIFHLIIGTMLARVDYAPLLVKDGAAAIAAVEVHQSALQGAILDIDMPNVDGIDAAYAIQQIAPELAIILVSGALPTDYANRIVHLRLAGTLQKPFSLTAFHALIQHALIDSAASDTPSVATSSSNSQ